MRTPLEIISEFKNVLYWSQPNIKYDEMLSLINELETSLSPVEEVVVEEPTVEIVEEVIVEETVIEEPTLEVIEEPVVEEPTVEVVVPKTTRKK